ncbi:colanic acid biosynthesis glycosyltransferase WcaL [bacterium]|nr:MAG: colanic acid biosynthesis glycosyltransferase WcaL [bacterium]
MKIAYLLDTYPSNSETFIAREIEALRRHGFEIEVFAFNAGEGATPIHQSWREKLSPRRWQNVGANLDLRAFAHVHAGWANHLALVAQSAAKRAGIPWSFSAHARDLWVEGGDLKAKLASAKFATSCTLAGTRELQKYGTNVIYAPHGLELKRYKFRRFQPRPNKPVRIVGVGRLVEKKGWFEAIHSVDVLNSQFQRAHLRLIGEGPLAAELHKRGFHRLDWYKQKGCIRPEGLHWYGALPHLQAIKVMRRCDCLVLPSRQTREGDRDGLANVLLEAAALGLPIVTTNAGSASDFVDDTTGLIVDAGDTTALTYALARVFQTPEQTKLRCENARRRIEERFDVERNIEVLARAFRS